ncbi:DUF2239 family protein [Kerstersia gyiorum]|jgi:hypothetical protein|uniref:DUF2239 family protein n=1 Tax=Kerstersia gyiorum TaxID=206506 RepID=UPI00242AF826|nr:DUF2239 family protein [Kerstersia gyiorum]MCH4272301.1 DUF2239 family protein [Kerstersia gyiorum]MCI1230386.1 DUF2239 family protein [Kerstersia gyiorum]
MMNPSISNSYSSFEGHRRIATGSLQANALAVKRARESGAAGPILIFDDTTGRSMDVDTRGSDDAVLARLAAVAPAADPAASPGGTEDSAGPRGRGRPRLGVIAREVTLLPRHWEWLAGQPGGASVALRKLVEEARRSGGEKDRARRAQERTYHFMLAIAGDLPGFEEVTRALFANDFDKFRGLLAAWPGDVRDHALQLASVG